MHLKKYALIFICLLLGFCDLFAQGEGACNHKKTIRIFNTNAAKLTRKLTKNLPSENEKVCAIYGWITSNIRYNIKKCASFNFKKQTPKKVLQRGMATCQGYADLFNAMCGFAGIQSVGVQGYVKGSDWDQGDTFYYEEHIWNAANVDGEWKLLDATWDAGYIKNSRLTLGGFILKIVTLGHRDIYAYHPHFVQKPSREFYLRTGNYFSFDHVASHPCWQMIFPVVNPDSFSMDSAFYFHRERNIENTDSRAVFDIERTAFAAMEWEDQWIHLGIEAYHLHQRNHFGIANAFALRAKHEIPNLDVEGDSADEVYKAIALLKKTDTGLLFYDSSRRDLKLQKAQLMRKANLKRYLCLQKDIKGIKQILNYKSQMGKGIRNVKHTIKSNKSWLYKDIRFKRQTIRNGFLKGKWAQSREKLRKKNKADSMIRSQLIIIDSIQQEIAIDFTVPNIHTLIQDSLGQFTLRCSYLRSLINQSKGARIFSDADDLDCIQLNYRDSTYHYLEMNRQIFTNDSELLFNYLKITHAAYAKKYRLLHKSYQLAMRGFVKYKSSILGDDGIVNRFQTFEKKYDSVILREKSHVIAYSIILRKLKRRLKKIKKNFVVPLLIDTRDEKMIEIHLNLGRKHFISRHYKGILAANKNNVLVAKRIASVAKRHLKKMQNHKRT